MSQIWELTLNLNTLILYSEDLSRMIQCICVSTGILYFIIMWVSKKWFLSNLFEYSVKKFCTFLGSDMIMYMECNWFAKEMHHDGSRCSLAPWCPTYLSHDTDFSGEKEVRCFDSMTLYIFTGGRLLYFFWSTEL